MADLTADDLKSLLSLDPNTGKLFWLERSPEMFPSSARCKRWNNRHAGKEAFTAKQNGGYLKGTIWGRWYKAHRVAWALHHGEWPTHDIDHINGVRSDNRIKNLRDVPTSVNCKNQKLKNANKYGATGISSNQDGTIWYAKITVNYRRINLGSFGSKQEAIEAREQANELYGFHSLHGTKLKAPKLG